MNWAEALNNALAEELPTREEMTERIIKMLSDVSYNVKKDIAIYIYDAGYQFQDSARGCLINAKKLNDTAITHIYNTLVESTKSTISIEEISLE